MVVTVSNEGILISDDPVGLSESDKKYIRHSISLALGAILAIPSNDDGKSELVQRLKMSLDKLDDDPGRIVNIKIDSEANR